MFDLFIVYGGNLYEVVCCYGILYDVWFDLLIGINLIGYLVFFVLVNVWCWLFDDGDGFVVCVVQYYYVFDFVYVLLVVGSQVVICVLLVLLLVGDVGVVVFVYGEYVFVFVCYGYCVVVFDIYVDMLFVMLCYVIVGNLNNLIVEFVLIVCLFGWYV